MKIHIWSDGDSSVGINRDNAEVEIIGMENWTDDPEEMQRIRDGVKEELAEAFSTIFDDRRIHIIYEDEIEEES